LGANVLKVAAGRGKAKADNSRESDPQPSANGMLSGDDAPFDAPTSPPPSAFAAEEVQSPATKAAAAKRALSAVATSAADAAAGSPAMAMSSAAGGSDSAAASPASLVAGRLDAGTGVLASSRVLAADHVDSFSVLVVLVMQVPGHHITRALQCS